MVDNFSSSSISLDHNNVMNIDSGSSNTSLWRELKSICEINREKVSCRFNDNNEFMSIEFVKERSFEVTNFIANKIESIFKIAVDESSDQVANLQTNEFLEQIIEQVKDLSWLMLSIPLDSGRHFWRVYKERFDQVLDMIEGLERIWWSIKRGYCGIPRNRDYSTACLFKSLPINSLENAQKNLDTFVEQLNESWNQLKSLNAKILMKESKNLYFLKKCSPVVKLTLSIFKKIRFQYINKRNEGQVQFQDNILDEAVLIVPIIKEIITSMIILPCNRPIICKKIDKLNPHLNRLIGIILEKGSESDSESGTVWFERNIKQLNLMIGEIEEMNPDR